MSSGTWRVYDPNLSMSSKALVWPVRSLLALNSCPKRFNGLQHSHISQSAIQRPSRLHAYRVNPNNRRGDEYGPMWPPTPSAADEDDGAPCLSVLLDDTPKSHDRQEGPNFKESSRMSFRLKKSCSIMLMLYAAQMAPAHSCRAQASLSRALCARATGGLPTNRHMRLHKHLLDSLTWTGVSLSGINMLVSKVTHLEVICRGLMSPAAHADGPFAAATQKGVVSSHQICV